MIQKRSRFEPAPLPPPLPPLPHPVHVYCKAKDELPVYLKTKIPSCIPKKKLKLCISV